MKIWNAALVRQTTSKLETPAMGDCFAIRQSFVAPAQARCTRPRAMVPGPPTKPRHDEDQV
jgi:hypothetical protein